MVPILQLENNTTHTSRHLTTIAIFLCISCSTDARLLLDIISCESRKSFSCSIFIYKSSGLFCPSKGSNFKRVVHVS